MTNLPPSEYWLTLRCVTCTKPVILSRHTSISDLITLSMSKQDYLHMRDKEQDLWRKHQRTHNLRDTHCHSCGKFLTQVLPPDKGHEKCRRCTVYE